MRPWKITWSGHTWTDDDALAGHLVALEELLGISGWDAVSPWRSPRVLAGWIAVLVSSTTGEPIEACVEQVAAAKASALLEALDDPDPTPEEPVEDVNADRQ